MIRYFTEEIIFNFENKRKHSNWLKNSAASENFKIGDLNYIFCSDEYLLNLNKQHLNHDYYTDIITFDNSDTQNIIAGDIFISIDRVKENAISHKCYFEEELRRVLIHGLLHLCGYNDKTKVQQIEMRSKEDYYIHQY